jgi:hypothetical protein
LHARNRRGQRRRGTSRHIHEQRFQDGPLFPAIRRAVRAPVAPCRPHFKESAMDDVTDLLALFFNAVPAWLEAGLAVIAAASAVTALTPSPKDDNVLAGLRRLLEMLALNIGHARPRR